MKEDEELVPHLISMIVQGVPQPRGKVFPVANGKWVFRRDVRAENVLYKVAPYESPPGGLTLEPEVLDYLEKIGVSELHYVVEGIGLLTLPRRTLQTGRWWKAGGRPQRMLPCYRWEPRSQDYVLPKIPDHLVYICGQNPRKPGTGYGPNTDGGTKEGIQEVTWPAARNAPTKV
jgi:hypothetical protein